MTTAHPWALALIAFGACLPAAEPSSGATPAPLHGCCQHPAVGHCPLEKPWIVEGIGSAHFPITTSNPEVQKWFDQGTELLDCFWDAEAERAFRWCLKLDPDCAMAWWGLARAVNDYRDVAPEMNEAMRRRRKVSARERRYIEAWAAFFQPGKPEITGNAEKLSERMESISADYPDDLEARVIIGQLNLSQAGSVKGEQYLRLALALAPDSVGAHHFRVHTWDETGTAEKVLDDVEALTRLAPASPHIQHMPGHIYCKLGRWPDAEAAMERAANLEVSYLREHLLMPFTDWNYAHNRNYLNYIEEQLGRPDAALAGARELLAAPLDPEVNDPEKSDSIYGQGRSSMVRALVKFERWPEILDGKTIPWGNSLSDKVWRSYCEARAWIGTGNLPKAEAAYGTHRRLSAQIRKLDDAALAEIHAIQSLELGGRIELAHHKIRAALGHLQEAAKRESAFRQKNNDPPIYPACLYETLGEIHLDRQAPAEAVVAFGNALDAVPNDGFALAGLVQAYRELRKDDEARNIYTRLQAVWSRAQGSLRWLEKVQSGDAGRAEAPPAEGAASSELPDSHPAASVWQPSLAPPLSAVDAIGQQVALEKYRPRSVVLVFGRPSDGPSLVAQLKGLEKASERLDRAAMDVVVVLNLTPEALGALAANAGVHRLSMVADPDLENTRRFKAYDNFTDGPANATLLIDPKGHIRWSRYGGKPFLDMDFLLRENRRIRTLLDLTEENNR